MKSIKKMKTILIKIDCCKNLFFVFRLNGVSSQQSQEL